MLKIMWCCICYAYQFKNFHAYGNVKTLGQRDVDDLWIHVKVGGSKLLIAGNMYRQYSNVINLICFKKT